MQLLSIGIVGGVLAFMTLLFLMAKLPPAGQMFIYRHALLTDVTTTVMAYTFLPISGSATLISTGIFCLLMSIYLFIKQRQYIV